MNASKLRAGWALIVLLGCNENVATPAADAATSDSPTTTDRAPDTPDTALTCTPGALCGHDCLPSDAPCWQCGELTFDSQCRCVAPQGMCAPASGCDNPAPARAGEFCGTYRWCNRPCATGLTCTGIPPGSTNPGDYRRVCVQAGDAGAQDAATPSDAGGPTFQLRAPDGGAFACGTRTCAPGQVCVRDCSGIDAGPVDLHRCVSAPSGCDASGRCACRSVCFTGQCTQESSGVVACQLCV